MTARTIKVSEETYQLIQVAVAQEVLKNPAGKINPNTILNQILKKEGVTLPCPLQ